MAVGIAPLAVKFADMPQKVTIIVIPSKTTSARTPLLYGGIVVGFMF